MALAFSLSESDMVEPTERLGAPALALPSLARSAAMWCDPIIQSGKGHVRGSSPHCFIRLRSFQTKIVGNDVSGPRDFASRAHAKGSPTMTNMMQPTIERVRFPLVPRKAEVIEIV